MSTDHQQYSTDNQRDKIREYAARRGIEIVRTYANEGKSGLRIDGRQALQQLIKDVESGATDFKVILAYDVSMASNIRCASTRGPVVSRLRTASTTGCTPSGRTTAEVRRQNLSVTSFQVNG